jgi:tight adherence protein B
VDNSLFLVLGLLAVYLGFGAIVVLWVRSAKSVSLDRRRPSTADASETTLNRAAAKAVETVNKSLRGRDVKYLTTDKFEQAGVTMRAGDFVLVCASGAVGVGVLGSLVAHVGLGILLALLFVVGMFVWLNMKASARQAKFADQLPDTLQLLAGSMRAGHSLLRAFDAAAEQSPQPMADELRRVVNESRIGRDLGDALIDTAARTKSEDFLWTAQAIETQREVGGNLAEVLDNVNETIRARAQLARQVQALAAEGKLSMIILIGLPVVLLIIISIINHSYATTFFTTLPGWLMLGASAVMLTIGALWTMRLIRPKF